MAFRAPLGAYGVGRPTRSFSAAIRFILVAACITLVLLSCGLYYGPQVDTLQRITAKLQHTEPTAESELLEAVKKYDLFIGNHTAAELHPIDRLIASSRKKQEDVFKEQSHHVDVAAAMYRERRGRHPPPGFDKWMAYAKEHNAIVVEHFFDRIYLDLAPFWALDPKMTAARAESWHHVVRVRNGSVQGIGNTDGLVAWLQLWTALVAEAAPHLPDVDMPINYMDEPRLLVGWEDIAAYVAKEEKGRAVVPMKDVIQNYTGLADIDAQGGGNGSRAYDPDWIRSDSPRYWDLAQKACPPGSPSRDVPALSDFSHSPSLPHNWKPSFSENGYVKNFSAAADVCSQPHIRYLHGSFVEPVSISTSTELIPLFGGCKLTRNNEILIPGAMYLTDDPFYSGGEDRGPPWAQKNTTIVWRGAASGGRNKKENWTHFQRHRMLEMLNGTTVSRLEKNNIDAMTFEMASPEMYNFPRRLNGTIGEVLQRVSDTGFTDLLCYPQGECDYITPHAHVVPNKPMREQYGDKFIPDADGNSFSARFRSLLLSTSLPLKATIYAEWHDDRLQPWQHFVPLDNTFQELHAVLDYFLSSEKGDAAAHMIASAGKRWAEQVLRREDMLLYVWRLLLEFARVCDINRDRLGFIDDLK
ncbi:capsule associated protein [Grosmannia clavigera kw1407]|uniref:Capsule associated protein n=1 Tax=Grosmannia clavigera (strain kw1407 / UAMH 11150) TaxID=655863 RepID=F0XJD5_GROCL|nr:capsule associated protein [Grosmannia clavigera kw1407]EFX02087.1 capsule associated protein [Grosmannia clavigera kw1407]